MRLLVLAAATALLVVPPGLASGGRGAVPRTGDVLGTLVIPKLGVRAPMLEGTQPVQLNRGPSHYPWTWLPGEGETVAVAAHRTTRGAWFRRIDELERGDAIYVVMRPRFGGRSFRYRVTGRRAVRANAGRTLVRDIGLERLILTACHPPGSSAFRYAVFARPASR